MEVVGNMVRLTGCVAVACVMWLGTMTPPVFGQEEASSVGAAAQSLDEKLAQLDSALAQLTAQQTELERQRTELEALRAEVEALRSGAALAQPAQAAPPAPKQDRWEYSGYAQIHASWDQSADGTAQYRIRRFYSKLTYTPDEYVKGVLLVDTSANIRLLEAYMESAKGDVRVRLGQFMPAFAFEMSRSSQHRRVHDYARAYPTLFPGLYDLGLVARTAPGNPLAGTFSIGVMSGNGMNNADNNATKDVTLMYEQPLNRGRTRLALSGVWGEFTTSPTPPAAPVTTPKRLWNFGVSYGGRTWELQAEALGGQARGNSVLGGYVEGAYKTGRHAIYGRYDYYDPSTAVANDHIRGPILGYEYAWSARNKVSFEAALYADPSTAGGDRRYSIRWQTRW